MIFGGDEMEVYHMSDTLSLGEKLSPDYKESLLLAAPFADALARGRDCFYSVLYSAKYLWASLSKFGMTDMQTDFVKWAVEGVFEFVRRTEFPASCGRFGGNYYFESKEDCAVLYEIDWGRASEAERAAIRLFAVELAEDAPERHDMRLFDEAYDSFEEQEDLDAAIKFARRYFSGGQTDEPMWEILSGAEAAAVRDLTDWLHRAEK